MPLAFVHSLLRNKASITCMMLMFFGILLFDNEPSLACHWHSSVACRKIRHRSHARCVLSSVSYLLTRNLLMFFGVLFFDKEPSLACHWHSSVACGKLRHRSHERCLRSSVSHNFTKEIFTWILYFSVLFFFNNRIPKNISITHVIDALFFNKERTNASGMPVTVPCQKMTHQRN